MSACRPIASSRPISAATTTRWVNPAGRPTGSWPSITAAYGTTTAASAAKAVTLSARISRACRVRTASSKPAKGIVMKATKAA